MILGIDPGSSGAIAVFKPDIGHLSMIDMPVLTVSRNGKEKREVNPHIIASIFRDREPATAIFEKVGAMPGQGVSSMFQFGRSVGTVEGVLAALNIPVTYVTPQVWQKACGIRGGKDGSRMRAIELFPAYAQLFARKMDNGRADAACMAWWGATQS